MLKNRKERIGRNFVNLGKGILTSFLLIVFGMATGQEFEAKAKLDTTRMLIGDQTNLSISFKFPVTAKIHWPAVGDTILGYLPVIGRSKIDTAYTPDRKWITLHQTLRITSFDSGLYTIPPFRLYFREMPDTTMHYSQTEPLELLVHTVKVDTSQAIKPIKGLMKIPLTFREILPWLIAAVFAGLVIGFMVYYYRKRKKAEPVFRLKPRIVIPAYQFALNELEALRLKKLWQSGKIKEFYTEVTEIIRRYVEQQFDVMALESTTDEILEGVSRHPEISAGSRQKLQQMLTLADLVKFAKAHPLPVENEQSLQDAVDFVNSTIIVNEEQTAEKKEGSQNV